MLHELQIHWLFSSGIAYVSLESCYYASKFKIKINVLWNTELYWRCSSGKG